MSCGLERTLWVIQPNLLLKAGAVRSGSVELQNEKFRKELGMCLPLLTSYSSIALGSNRSQIPWKSYCAHKADDALFTLTTFNAK